MYIKKGKFGLNDGHYVEMLDRLHTVNIMIDELLYDHPVTNTHKKLKKLITKAQNKIIMAYQLTGSIDATQNKKSKKVKK